MKKWFKKHRKKLITHSAIISLFIIFLLFGAEPLFSRFNRVPGQAELQNIKLPPETNDLKYSIDHISTNKDNIEIEGWAFINELDTINQQVYLVFKNRSKLLIFDTLTRIRNDVTRAYSDLNINLDNSGFFAIIPRDKIGKYGYSIGIYVRNNSIEAFQYTNAIIEGESQLINLELPQESNNIIYNIEKIDFEDSFTKIVGWAFIEGMDTQDLKIYLVLQSPSETYIFDTFSQKRPDVTAAFKDSGLNLDYSGFISLIPSNRLPENQFTIGLLLQQRNYEYFAYTKSQFEITD